ncbi:uncharacterized protein M421DRAFT_148125 [Didymella exigua CBS 183.55]|uniref:Uncharacterized protein n=1 Tax=Didymella exigua CBS 183.55 TaxID=1150837 RepID=A0A6A5RSN5_9PLEO|nr:uncharacterized protein M421DRAFT_148125 [Didymella exigua CBS 183.55]KAF1928517.1 hypothetical protein M421DRAFT_148125 [Didymella exigua CBS 183.55]
MSQTRLSLLEGELLTVAPRYGRWVCGQVKAGVPSRTESSRILLIDSCTLTWAFFGGAAVSGHDRGDHIPDRRNMHRYKIGEFGSRLLDQHHSNLPTLFAGIRIVVIFGGQREGRGLTAGEKEEGRANLAEVLGNATLEVMLHWDDRGGQDESMSRGREG